MTGAKTSRNRVFARLLAWGRAFSPRAAEQALGVRFSHKNEPGDRGVTGRYFGRPTPYGSGTLEHEPGAFGDLIAADAWILGDPSLIAELRSRGATELVLYIDVEYEAQCNFELSPELLAALSRLGVTVGFSCFQRDPNASEAPS